MLYQQSILRNYSNQLTATTTNLQKSPTKALLGCNLLQPYLEIFLIFALNPATANNPLYKLTVQKKTRKVCTKSYLLLSLISDHFVIHLL